MRPKFEATDTFEADLLAHENLKKGRVLADKGLVFSEYYLNPPERCDLCRASFAAKRFMIDGIVSCTGGMSACMCAKCFARRGTTIEWGRGQLYTQLENGLWLMSGGFLPS